MLQMSHPNYKSHTPIKKSNTYSIILEKKIKPNSTCLALIIKTVSMTTYKIYIHFVWKWILYWKADLDWRDITLFSSWIVVCFFNNVGAGWIEILANFDKIIGNLIKRF